MQTTSRGTPLVPRTSGHRQIFGWGAEPERRVQPLRVTPGVRQLAQLDEFLHMNTRPLASEKITKALEELFAHKRRTRTALLDTETRLAVVGLRHLLSRKDDDWEMTTETLVSALQCLELGSAASAPGDTAALADLLFEQIDVSKHRLLAQPADRALQIEAFSSYLRVLCSCNQAMRARGILESLLDRDRELFKDQAFWEPVLGSFIEQRSGHEIERTLVYMKEKSIPLDATLKLSVLRSFARQGNFKAAQEWHETILGQHPSESSQADWIFLDMCIVHRMLDAGKKPFQRLLEREPNKPTWDLILRWAAATGKGADEVERMMDVMIRRNAAAETPDRPDIETINGLVQLANDLKDPYRAERFIALAGKRGIDLNGKTFALQMEYRLGVGDVQGAYKAYQQMIEHDSADNADATQTNALIQKLCEANDMDMEAVSQCIETLHTSKADLEPATVAALTKLHLNRDEIHDLIDLLHTHAFRMGSMHRQPVIEIFKDFIVDESLPVSRAWDAYCILRQIFSEIDNETRTQIMLNFFKRGRSDYAVQVFGNMRQAQIKSKRPSREAYALCFQGLAHAQDPESFHLVYNMLKLDSQVEPDTYLRNALMLAMVRVGLARRALAIWEDIVYSREGPTYNSITLILYAIEETAIKADPDQVVWTRLQNFGVEPTKENFVAYIGALCGQYRTDDAIQKVEEMSRKAPSVVDAIT